MKLGNIVITLGAESILSVMDIGILLNRYQSKDWGDLDAEDKASNDYAIDQEQRILARYNINGSVVWIITEWDRSVTTILLPEEY